MTLHEKVVVTAYTGVIMYDLGELSKYASEKLGFPVFTHEFGSKAIMDKLHEASKDDFLELARS